MEIFTSTETMVGGGLLLLKSPLECQKGLHIIYNVNKYILFNVCLDLGERSWFLKYFQNWR